MHRSIWEDLLRSAGENSVKGLHETNPTASTLRPFLVFPSASMNRLSHVRNSYNFLSDILGRKNEIDAPACYCALWHIRLPGCVELLRDGNAPHFLYAA